MTTQLSSSMEDYLESIYVLSQEAGFAHVKDIAEGCRVSKASVGGAIKRLKRRDLVFQERYGYVQLTGRGERLAEAVLHKRRVLSRFLEEVLGLDPKIAHRDACKMKHAVSPPVLRRFAELTGFIKTCSKEGRLASLKLFKASRRG